MCESLCACARVRVCIQRGMGTNKIEKEVDYGPFLIITGIMKRFLPKPYWATLKIPACTLLPKPPPLPSMCKGKKREREGGGKVGKECEKYTNVTSILGQKSKITKHFACIHQ